MANFYKFSHEELLSMEANEFHQYWLAINVVEAQDMLKAMRISDYPHQKDEDRKKLHRSLIKQAYPTDLKPKDESQVNTAEDLARFLQGAMNGR